MVLQRLPKTLFIDIGEVLVGLDYREPLGTIQKLSGLPAPEVQRRLRECPDLLLYEKGLLSTDEFFRRMMKLLDLDSSLQEFKKAWARIFVFGSEAGKPLFSAGLFRRLKDSYRLVALSNTNELHFSYLSEVYPLVNEFHDYVLSYRVGAIKPEPEIYEIALERAGCVASETLFIDDRPENVRAAEHLGIKGIVFVGEPELRVELERLGVTIDR